jgi:trimethylamine--corrinoid protein Co-methyltransferase
MGLHKHKEVEAMTGFSFRAANRPRFNVLTDTQIRDLHLATLELLRRTGIRFFSEEAVGLLKNAGAFVQDGNLVKFPAQMVEKAIASAPSRVTVCDRDGEPAMFLEGDRSYFGPGSDCLNLLDHSTGERRDFTRQDLVNGYRLCDALPNIHFVMSLGIPTDVKSSLAYDTQMALMLEHTTKPIVFVTDDESSCRRAVEMAAIVAGGLESLREQQHILAYIEPSSPLKQTRTALDKLLLMAELGLPVVHSTSPMMGATAPITMAGGLVLSFAEVLSGLVLHQLKNPGAPFIMGAGLRHMDMRSMQICYGSPEFQLTRAAITEMSRWYGLPAWGFAGCSDAKSVDQQASIEATLSVVLAKLDGTNLVHDVGYLESGLTTSFEMIVLADELVAMGNHVLKGVEVSDGTLSLDETHETGPGGVFVDSDSTLKHFRDFWFPGLLDRDMWHSWAENGSLTLSQRLSAKVTEIIEEHRAKPLARQKSNELKHMIDVGDIA